MSAAARRLPPRSDGEEVPLCATHALAHALAATRGRFGPTSEDLVDAAYALVGLRATRWDVRKSLGQAGERTRSSVLAGVMEPILAQKRAAAERDRLEVMVGRELNEKEMAAVVRDTTRPLGAAEIAGMESAVAELRNLGFDLWEAA